MCLKVIDFERLMGSQVVTLEKGTLGCMACVQLWDGATGAIEWVP